VEKADIVPTELLLVLDVELKGVDWDPGEDSSGPHGFRSRKQGEVPLLERKAWRNHQGTGSKGRKAWEHSGPAPEVRLYPVNTREPQ
jgi:hypothetical protein